MAKFFKTVGLIYFFACIGLLIYLLISSESNLLGIVSVIMNSVLGLALIAIGDLMDRVDSLEGLKTDSEKTSETKTKIQQIKCLNCSKMYDMDYPKCPNCGHHNDQL
jgi:cell shape-determining protein MreC